MPNDKNAQPSVDAQVMLRRSLMVAMGQVLQAGNDGHFVAQFYQDTERIAAQFSEIEMQISD